MGAAKELARADVDSDAKITGRVVESLVLRGDISALNADERARYYVSLCDSLGLNAATQPFAVLRLNGKEILYPTRGATDQLAAMHRVNRRIIDGPKVVDVAGTKLVYALCEASLPNGRVETATATVPLQDPVNVLMKCETKAKRRATLSILGLAMLDETELETIPASAKQPAPQIDVTATASPAAATAVLARDYAEDAEPEAPAEDVPEALALFREHVEFCGADLTYQQAAAVWIDHRRALGANWGPKAWGELLDALHDVPKPKSKHAELKRAVKAAEPQPPAPTGTDGPANERPEAPAAEAPAPPPAEDRSASQARLLVALNKARECTSSNHLVNHAAAHVDELPEAQRRPYLEAVAEYGWRRYPRALKNREFALEAFEAARAGKAAA
jgi:hypothetical protein